MAYTKLLAYAQPNDPGRDVWSKMLTGLPSIDEFPKVLDADMTPPVTLWADAAGLPVEPDRSGALWDQR